MSHFGFHRFIHRSPTQGLHCCLLRLCPPIYLYPGSSNTFSHLTWAYAYYTWMIQPETFSESLLLVLTPDLISKFTFTFCQMLYSYPGFCWSSAMSSSSSDGLCPKGCTHTDHFHIALYTTLEGGAQVHGSSASWVRPPLDPMLEC